MLRKFLHGLAFGTGLGLSLIAASYIYYYHLLPGEADTQFAPPPPGTAETDKVPERSSPAVTSAPPITEETRYLGSASTFSNKFVHNTSRVLISGPGAITGSVTADGQPVAGLKLALALNGGVMSQWATTDPNGRYTIPVPYGKYRIDGFELDKQSANTHLPGKIEHPQAPHKSGRFIVSEKSPGHGLDFRFVTPVTMDMPKTRYSTSEDILLEWYPYPGATRYKIQVYEKTGRHGANDGHRLFDRSHRPFVSGTGINLQDYDVWLDPGYYTVEIEALDDDMNILSRTALNHGDYDFEITAS